jgi:acyl carrier protein
MNTLKIITILLMCLPFMAVAIEKNLPLSEAKKVAAESVLNQTAKVLEISGSQVNIDLPFSKQVSPADNLDFIEVIMAVESELDVSINDSELKRISGTTDENEIINFLSIRKLQEFVGTLPLPSSPKKPTPPSVKGPNVPLALGDSGAYGELAIRPNPDGLTIVTIPDINDLIASIEQQSGRQLAAEEIKEFQAIAPSLVMSPKDAEELKKLRASRSPR